MGYVGNRPAANPLTSADINDGIITSAKIADGTIVNADINASAAIVASKLTGISSQPFRNIVINGDMQIAQRSTSVASITGTGYYTLDRFRIYLTTLGTWTMSQSTDVPSGYGFAYSTKLDCTTADASPSAGDLMAFAQQFEGQNLQYLKKGTANAVSLTASFWVKSTKTGTFILELKDEDNNRSISKSYTVSASNTWEFKTITFAGDTTGAFTNDNGASLNAIFWLGAGTDYTSGTLATAWQSNTNANRAVGQVNIADSTSNDFLITGVQLEAGTSASDFEFLPYDVSLGRCQRYYYKTLPETNGRMAVGYVRTTTGADTLIFFPTRMRSVASALEQSGTATDYTVLHQATSTVCSAVPVFQQGTVESASIRVEVASGLTAGDACIVRSNNTSGYFGFSAEL
jgi:hypothetical protein